MKATIAVIKLIFLAPLLTSCGEKTQSVEWYIEHKEQLNKALEKCELKSPDELAKSANCKNAKDAKYKLWREQQTNAPMPEFKFK